MILGEDPKHVFQLNTNLSLSLSLCLSPSIRLSLSLVLDLASVLVSALVLVLALVSALGLARRPEVHLGVIWRRTSEIDHFHCKNFDFHQNVEKAKCFLIF